MMGTLTNSVIYRPTSAPSVVSPVLTSVGSSEDFDLESLEDQAELLLSISDIARSEIIAHPLALKDASLIPPFPTFGGEAPIASLTPRTQPIRDIMFPSLSPSNTMTSSMTSSKRLRAVSIDLAPKQRTAAPHRHTPSPPPFAKSTPPIVSPTRTPRTVSFRSTRLSQKARRSDDVQEELLIPTKEQTGKSLQAKPPKGMSITKIRRRKFSWKNYPELEEFLVANREEYLRHSALNYTLQQKQYNNRLTERLLEIATAHGYVFDTHDFGFVTVRDRIRCYYKSYVQSAKKRGVLMGYAARKAGLLTEEDLSMGQQGEIVTPGLS